MNASHATLSFFAVLALAGCTTMQVRTDYDAEVSFTQLSTYDWGDQEADASADPAVNSPLLERHIQDAVEGELGRMGYRKVTSDAPDLRIVYRVTAEEKSRIDGSYGYGSYGYGGPYVYPRSSYRGSFGLSLYGGRYLRPFYGYPGAGYGGTRSPPTDGVWTDVAAKHVINTAIIRSYYSIFTTPTRNHSSPDSPPRTSLRPASTTTPSSSTSSSRPAGICSSSAQRSR